MYTLVGIASIIAVFLFLYFYIVQDLQLWVIINKLLFFGYMLQQKKRKDKREKLTAYLKNPFIITIAIGKYNQAVGAPPVSEATRWQSESKTLFLYFLKRLSFTSMPTCAQSTVLS